MPLTDVTILDLSAYAPGRYASMLLGDFGADVIAVEAPAARGERDRANDAVTRSRRLGTNPTYRSRRSIGIDLKVDAGRELLLRLAEGADVLVEGFRPGTSDRLGIGYDDVSPVNPRLVYCSISGYGQTGPRARRAGHDLNYLAESGILAMTTRPGQRPAIPGNVVGDYAAGGLLAAFAILAALRQRDRTGKGTHLDVSMLAGVISLAASIEAWRDAGDPDPSWGAALVSGAVPFYDCYETADGAWLSVAALEPKFYANLCALLERPDLAPLQDSPEEWPRLLDELERLFKSGPLQKWLDLLQDEPTCVAPVISLEDAFQLGREEGFVHDVARVEPIRGLPYSGAASPPVRQPGRDTFDVLVEVGLTPEEAAGLIERGACYAAVEDAPPT